MAAVTITVVVGLNDGSPQYVPVSQSATPDPVSVPLGHGPQTVTFTLTPGSGSPDTTALWFAQNADGSRRGMVVIPRPPGPVVGA